MPINYGIPKDAPEKIQKAWSLRTEGYYGFYYITVNEFRNWFLKYRPDIDAGWVSTYDKWRIEKKNYIPDSIQHYLDKNDNIHDMHFIEITNPYDCSAWLYQYLTEAEDVEPTDLLVYYFDR